MADHLHTVGQVVLDAGAVQKLVGEGKSLLPIGVTDVHGEFGRGAVITCIGPDGAAVARGISNYTSAEARRIQRKPSAEIAAILGYAEGPELIHRDNLVLI
jgi:glutamate 5-kinase